MNTQPSWWLLYVAIGLMGLVAISKVGVATMPDKVRAFLDDPTAITFSAAETNGRTCSEMQDEALARGAKRWACWH